MAHISTVAVCGGAAVPGVMAPGERRQTFHPLQFVHTVAIRLNACPKAALLVCYFE